MAFDSSPSPTSIRRQCSSAIAGGAPEGRRASLRRGRHTGPSPDRLRAWPRGSEPSRPQRRTVRRRSSPRRGPHGPAARGESSRSFRPTSPVAGSEAGPGRPIAPAGLSDPAPAGAGRSRRDDPPRDAPGDLARSSQAPMPSAPGDRADPILRRRRATAPGRAGRRYRHAHSQPGRTIATLGGVTFFNKRRSRRRSSRPDERKRSLLYFYWFA
jgi:hypothetical protein